MHMTDIISKKRRGTALSREEIQHFIQGYVSEEIPDYQISALLMAIWFQGMNAQETTDLTLAMMHSGDVIDLSQIPGIKVDKHSTGGVADTTTLICAPLVAACGGKVAKMSGRGLGHTGGTLDKLEAIPGFNVSLSMQDFQNTVRQCGLSVIGQTGNLVPADKKLYSLRDVTVTVDNISLIASSIMSKKLAAGSNAIVLDVKTGSGAFMKDLKDSIKLAKAMVDIGKLSNVKTMALVTDMNQPLGNAIGNALEVQEAIEILKGEENGDLKDVSLALAAQMLIASGICDKEEQALESLHQAIKDRSGLNALSQCIQAQGGDASVCEDTSKLPQAKELIDITADDSGYLSAMQTDEIGMAAMLLGAGRAKTTDTIDPAVGIWLQKRLGDKIEKGDVLAQFYVNDTKNFDEALQRFVKALDISPKKPQEYPLIYNKIGE